MSMNIEEVILCDGSEMDILHHSRCFTLIYFRGRKYFRCSTDFKPTEKFKWYWVRGHSELITNLVDYGLLESGYKIYLKKLEEVVE